MIGRRVGWKSLQVLTQQFGRGLHPAGLIVLISLKQQILIHALTLC
jgi:hypothetical protein